MNKHNKDHEVEIKAGEKVFPNLLEDLIIQLQEWRDHSDNDLKALSKIGTMSDYYNDLTGEDLTLEDCFNRGLRDLDAVLKELRRLSP